MSANALYTAPWLTRLQYRVFEQIMLSLPSDGSEELGLILAASKLLDLLLVLQTEEFQMLVAPARLTSLII